MVMGLEETATYLSPCATWVETLQLVTADARNTARMGNHACNRTHGTVEDLLALIPAPAPSIAKGDPFVTLSPRAAKAWLALFGHARTHGTWGPRPVDPSRPELTAGQQYILTARWTVAGLGYAMGCNRDTAGKALKELADGGWVRREDPRNKGQFGGIDYALAVPTSITQADKAKVAEVLRKRGVEFVGYRWRTAARVLEVHEINRVQEDIILEIETERADLAGDKEKAVELASQRVLPQRMLGKKQETPSSTGATPTQAKPAK